MSETRKLKNILIRLRERLQKSGITNRSKWTSFSSNPEMSATQFTRRLNSLGISITAKDTTALWKMMQVSSNVLKFEDFVKLIESPLPETNTPKSPERKPPSPSPRPVPSTTLIMQTLATNRKALLLKLGECDPLTTGRIANSDFRSVCDWFDPRMSPESSAAVDAILNRYDPGGSGSFNYFRFLADLCDGEIQPPETPKRNRVSFVEVEVEPEPEPEPEPEVVVKPEQIVRTSPKRSHSNNSGIDDDLLRAATYDDYSEEESFEEPELEVPQTITAGARQNLDPMIFPGLQRHSRPQTEAQARQKADEIVGTEKMNGLTHTQVLNILAECILKTAKGAKEYFQKWRGQHERIDASDIRDGLAKDMKILIPHSEISALVRRYGGPMTLSTFVRMLADGAKMSDEPTRSPGRTDDDAAIVKISEQVHGTGWEDIVYNSTSAEDIVSGFAERGIKVTSGEIRTLTSKLGRTGLVSAIRARMR